GDADAAERDEEEPELDLAELVVDVAKRRYDLDRVRLVTGHEEPHVLAVVMRFEVEVAAVSRRHTLRLLHAREHRRDALFEPEARAVRRALCVDELPGV